MHGAKGGRPVTTGRQSKYAQVFGPAFTALLTDPDILKANSELALLDLYIGQQVEVAKDGLGLEWLEQVRTVFADLSAAMFTHPDPAKVRSSHAALKDLLEAGGDRARAWQSILNTIPKRADIAVKADAVIARREATLSEQQVAVAFARALDIMAEIAGEEVARKVSMRWNRELVAQPGQQAVN